MKSDQSSFAESSSNASNDFLDREIQRLEAELEATHRDLLQIQQSHAWKIVEGYRRWIARHRYNSLIGLYEKFAMWMLDKSVGSDRDESTRYRLWLEAQAMSPERIEAARIEAATLPYRPLISVVLEATSGAATKYWLKAAVESLRAQLYDNWQLHIIIDATARASVEAMLSLTVPDDPRILVTYQTQSNGAISSAVDLPDCVQGEFTAFLGEREQLGVDNFYEIVKRLNRNPAIDLFYWDEDRIDSQGQRTKPFFRPDWSPILLLSMNYIGECFVLRTALARNLERTSLSSAPSRNYDLALRAVERTDRIVHIPEVLSHRREGAISSPDDDGAAAERDRENARAIDAALRRRGEAGRVEITGPGLYAARYDIRDQPLVSILIPTRDKCQLLRQCLESIERNTDYKNYQIIVLDNDSSEPETFAYFEQISRKVEIHRYRGQFNFSAINNYGAAESKGEFLLFLNNDTQVIRADWMRALIEQAQRPEVGAVGAKLLFADGRIQHAGAVLGIGGLVGHAFRLTSGNQPHYFGLSDVIRDCSAVTAACMMMRRSVFDEVEGYDEKLQVDFADIDLCLRLRRRRYRIVYTPLSLLYHYESVTRRRMHVASDYDIFIKRWGHCLRTPDPHYGRNLTLEREDWTIAP